MSHITTVSTKIVLKNEQMIKTALTVMSKQFKGMTFQKMDNDTIMVRYTKIENYQTHGNMRFIRDPATNVWSMQLDTWMCDAEIAKVREAFFVQYQTAAVGQFLAQKGYSTTKKQDGKNMVLTAVRY